jgi:hypothetical protein
MTNTEREVSPIDPVERLRGGACGRPAAVFRSDPVLPRDERALIAAMRE